jgi:hypothetical protein
MQSKIVFLWTLAATALFAQNQPVLGEDTVKVSDHVWAIMGWPNIAVVVGNRATLVVDTGLGRAMALPSLESRQAGARQSEAVPYNDISIPSTLAGTRFPAGDPGSQCADSVRWNYTARK